MVDELPPGCARPLASALLRSFASLGSATLEALTAASVLAPTFIPHSLLASITGGPVDARTLEPVVVLAGFGLREQNQLGLRIPAKWPQGGMRHDERRA